MNYVNIFCSTAEHRDLGLLCIFVCCFEKCDILAIQGGSHMMIYKAFHFLGAQKTCLIYTKINFVTDWCLCILVVLVLASRGGGGGYALSVYTGCMCMFVCETSVIF